MSSFLTVLAVIALLLPMSGCTDSGDDDNGNEDETVTLILASPSVVERVNESLTMHDAFISINKIMPTAAVVKWSDIRIVIKDSSGSVLLTETELKKSTGSYPDTLEVWYAESAGEPDNANPSDEVVISGMMASEYEGAYVELFHKGARAGSVTLPTDFP